MKQFLPLLVLVACVAGVLMLVGRPRGEASEWQRRAQLPAADAETLKEVRRPFEARLRATERDVVRLTLEPMRGDDRFASKVGGAPYLPAGEQMPKSITGAELYLLAQVNFAEMPPTTGYPRDGILQFYICGIDKDGIYGMDSSDERYSEAALSEQRYFRVRYFPAPLAVESDLAEVAVADSKGTTPHDPRKPRRMRFSAGREEISALDASFPKLVGVEPHGYIESEADRLGRNPDSLADVFNTGSGHKIGGFPYFTQTDPRAPDTRLRLLLQLDSDDEMMWGDAGVGSFFIDPLALERADFSRVMLTWDNH